jgi:tetratricopeptide (TPR) repeat protein
MDKMQLLSAIQQVFEDKNLTEWAKLAEKAVLEFPTEAFGYYYKGEYLLALSDIDAAVPLLKKAVDIEPVFDYQLALGLAKMQANEDEAAKEIFDKLLTVDSKNADLHYALALYHLGNSDEEASLESLNQALNINAAHINALDLRAYVHKNLDNDEEALEDLNKLLEIDETSIPWRFQRIEILKGMEEREAIETDFRFLIEHHPIDIEFRTNFGDYFLEIGEYQEAIYCYSDAIDIEKRAGTATAHPFKKRAAALLRKADYIKAIDDFKNVMKLDDEDPDAYLGLADAYLAMQKPELSLNYLEIGLDAVFDARWRLYQKQGEIALELKQYDEAEAAFIGMTKDVQGKAEGFYQLGALYLRQGDLEMAFKALKEADENLHDLADDMIQTHLKQYLLSDTRLAEKELQAEYEDEIENNAKSPALSKAFGKLWKLDEKKTLDSNSILGQLPAEMKETILQAFKGMLLRISPAGFLIFNLGQDDTRAVYSINSENGENIDIEMLPFGRSSTKEMSFKASDSYFALCGIGSDSAAMDLYFSSCNFNELPEKMQQNYKEKEAAGNMDFLS